MNDRLAIVGVLGAAAGLLAAIAVRELVAAGPALGVWLKAALAPLARARREGYAPTEAEMRRLALLVTGFLAGGSVLILGVGPVALLASAGPMAAASLVSARRDRYRRDVERGLSSVATALADALAAGGSTRAALIATAGTVEGAPRAEMRRVGCELSLGVPTRQALAGMRTRVDSVRVEALLSGLISSAIGGGDLVCLLRRTAASAAEREETVAQARAATAQARFTGLLVVAMPGAALVFAELAMPGFARSMVTTPAALACLLIAAALQLFGFAAISRLSRIDR